MFKVPQDIIDDLQKKYPKYDIESFIHDIFDKILNKTLYDGSCLVRELGKFSAFKTYSTKLSKETPRLKFKTSNSLVSKLRDDQYVLDHLAVQDKAPYTEAHEEVCKTKRHIRDNRTSLLSEASKKGHAGTQDKLVRKEVLKLIDED